METNDRMKHNAKPTILIIEDDETVRKSIAGYLEDRGYNILQAENSEIGLEAFRQSTHEMVLLDLRLPGMSGLETLEIITKEDANIPVVIISATGNIEDAISALRLGAADYILKPIVDMEVLLHTVKKNIDKARLVQQNREYKQNLDAIFKSIKDAIITVDNDFRVVEFNTAAEDICGLSKCHNTANSEEYKSFMDSCGGQCIEAINETMQTKRPSERSRFECCRHDNVRRVVSLATYPLLDANNRFKGCVMTLKDETQLDNLENDLHERSQLHNIIGSSNEIRKIYSLVDVLSKIQTTVLISGENGTGKGLVAEALHYHNSDTNRPFVVVNCAALSDNLLESELFGHVKGAYTGAVNDRIGRFQMADGGTVFLDEIGDISNTMQLRLLRVLQEMEFERLGESKTIKVNLRVIAATNQNLQKKVRSGKFREDLYYRLKVAEIIVPPLRDRREDIPTLIDYFIKKLNKKLNKNIKSVSTDVQELFMTYKWPGNVRELQHVLEFAFILCDKPIITLENLPQLFLKHEKTETKPLEKKERFTKHAIADALVKTGWNKSKAARLLQIGRRTLYMKIDEYELKEV